jgi:hypothetical protein
VAESLRQVSLVDSATLHRAAVRLLRWHGTASPSTRWIEHTPKVWEVCVPRALWQSSASANPRKDLGKKSNCQNMPNRTVINEPSVLCTFS